jgi:hypothetical protein
MAKAFITALFLIVDVRRKVRRGDVMAILRGLGKSELLCETLSKAYEHRGQKSSKKYLLKRQPHPAMVRKG